MPHNRGMAHVKLSGFSERCGHEWLPRIRGRSQWSAQNAKALTGTDEQKLDGAKKSKSPT